jgi:hypothetical protein
MLDSAKNLGIAFLRRSVNDEEKSYIRLLPEVWPSGVSDSKLLFFLPLTVEQNKLECLSLSNLIFTNISRVYPYEAHENNPTHSMGKLLALRDDVTLACKLFEGKTL